MIHSPKTITAEEIQFQYKKIANHIKKTGQSVIVLDKNKPDIALIPIKKLEEIQAIIDVLQSREEVKKGKAKLLKGSLKDLWYEAQKH